MLRSFLKIYYIYYKPSYPTTLPVYEHSSIAFERNPVERAMSKTNGIQIQLGSIPIGDQKDPTCRFNTPEAAREYLNLFRTRGYDRIDTARIYPSGAPGTTEQILGQADATTDFVIDTKIVSFFPGAHKAGSIQKSVDESLAALRTSKVSLSLPSANSRF